MSEAPQIEGPRWRSGPFVYGAVLVSLPLLLGILWVAPTLLPSLLKGHASAVKSVAAVGWGLLLFACPLGALLYRRRYVYSEDWQLPRRLSIVLAGMTYIVSVASYAAVGFFLLQRGF